MPNTTPDATIITKDGKIVGYKVQREKAKWSVRPEQMHRFIGKTPDELPTGYLFVIEDLGASKLN